MPEGGALIIGADELDRLIGELRGRGFDTWGPVVRDGAIMPGRVSSLADLPVGWHDEQSAGRYELRDDDDGEVFGWAVGPGSWKSLFFPPSETVWEATASGGSVTFARDEAGPERPVALIGVRPCELAGLHVLDSVLLRGAVPDPAYARRRAGSFVVVAECSKPASTCFCSSMGTGPGAGDDCDLVVTELGVATGRQRFLMRPASARGADLLQTVGGAVVTGPDAEDRSALLEQAASAQQRHIDADAIPGILAAAGDSPRWQNIAERCLACGNCTLVCPTCFCSDVLDGSDLRGGITRTRTWSSCFDLDHSYLHGGPVRQSGASRYRQWMTHKLSTWHSQFGTSGCVGCGRCIGWCPVGIDITEEAAAFAAEQSGRNP